MRTLATVGTINKLSKELVVEWSIAQFSTLSRKEGDCYESPVFKFLGNHWYFRIYCNGERRNETEGYTGLYLMSLNITHPCSISCTFSLKSVGEALEYEQKIVYKFEKNNSGYGFPKLFKNSDVTSRSDDLLPRDLLTVRCTLMNGSYDKVSLLGRLLNVSRSMLDLLNGKKRTDVVLKLEGEEIQAHRVILEARSEFFQKMSSHDMLENRTGEIKMDDVEADVFQWVLSYLYGGIAQVTLENARPLYVAADRFNLQELKTLCVHFLRENMSDEIFCDAFDLADMYNDTNLMQFVREYLRDHSESIIKTEKWKKLVAEDPVRSTQILTTFVIINANKSK